MNILIIGSGGREHALTWKLAGSKHIENLFIAPGNAGTSALGINVDIAANDFPSLRDLVIDQKIDTVVVGPEQPLVEGISDFIAADPRTSGVLVIGPSAKGAMLEGSKDFAKQFMLRHGIPTAAYRSFHAGNFREGVSYLESIQPPFVLKADGLAAGKGVVICHDRQEAIHNLEMMLIRQQFGKAGDKVVIEQFLDGIELSAFVITDGQDYKILPEAKDYKRAGENDSGPNTGGMGSVSPVPFAGNDFMKKLEERIIKPTIRGLHSENIPYRGFIFFGLMNVKGDPYVIEYNARLGDPETEAIIPRISSDLAELFLSVRNNTLSSYQLEISPLFSASVMMVSGGYPGTYEKGKEIRNLYGIERSLVFHAGTSWSTDGRLLTNGGRVLAVTSLDKDLRGALDRSYESCRIIEFDNHYYRSDIGTDLLRIT